MRRAWLSAVLGAAVLAGAVAGETASVPVRPESGASHEVESTATTSSQPGETATIGPATLPRTQGRTPAAIHRIFARFDLDGDGRLGPEEYSRHVRDPSGLPLDPDCDGWVSESEFAQSFLLNYPPSELLTSEAMVSILMGGRAMAQAGLWRRAVLQYQYLTDDTVTSCDGFLGAARCQRVLGRPDLARQLLERAARLEPNVADVWLELGLLAFERGEDGRRELERGLGILAMTQAVTRRLSGAYWHDRAVWETAGRVLRFLSSRDEWQPAAAEVRRWADSRLRDPGPPPAPSPPSLGQIALLAQAGRLNKALAHLERAGSSSSRDWRFAAARAAVETALGRFDKARRSLEEAEAAGADRPILECLRIGNDMDRNDRHQALVRLALLDPERLQQWEMMQLGFQLGCRGDWPRAVMWLTAASNELIETPRTGLLLALCHMAVNASQDARSLLPTFASPTWPYPWYLKAAAGICKQLKAWKDARFLLETLAWSQPSEASGWLDLAAVHARGNSASDVQSTLWDAIFCASVHSARWNELALWHLWVQANELAFGVGPMLANSALQGSLASLSERAADVARTFEDSVRGLVLMELAPVAALVAAELSGAVEDWLWGVMPYPTADGPVRAALATLGEWLDVHRMMGPDEAEDLRSAGLGLARIGVDGLLWMWERADPRPPPTLPAE